MSAFYVVLVPFCQRTCVTGHNQILGLSDVSLSALVSIVLMSACQSIHGSLIHTLTTLQRCEGATKCMSERFTAQPQSEL